MRLIFITVTLAILCIFSTISESSPSKMYVNSGIGIVEYTDFDASTRTIIASGLGAGRGIDVDSNGNLYAAFTSGNIYKFDRNPDGTLDPNYYLYATECGNTHGIAFDENDNLYAADYSSGKVYKLNFSWSASSNITGSTSYIQAPTGVYGITIDSRGYIYISTESTYKYNSAGTILDIYTTIPSQALVIWQDPLYTVSADVYKLPLATDDSAPGYTASSLGVVKFISGLAGSAGDFEVDDNLYLSCYSNNLIYHYDQNGNPVGDGIFDTGVT